MIWANSEEHNRLFKTAVYKSDINTVDHESSKTSRAVAELEGVLVSKLKTIVKKMQTEVNLDIGVLRQKYGEIVNGIIASTVQNVYLESLRYVERFNEKPVMLSTADINKIADETRRFNDQFWTKATAILKRNDSLLNDYDYEERNPLNVQSNLALLSTSLTVGLLSSATLEKVRSLSAEDQKDVKLVWITALDERVCPICRPLHGREWELSDPTILTPGPADSHHNCRCRLVLKYKGEVFSN